MFFWKNNVIIKIIKLNKNIENHFKQFKHLKKKNLKKLTPKSCRHNTVPLHHFQGYAIILESVDTIVYPHTKLYPTLSCTTNPYSQTHLVI